MGKSLRQSRINPRRARKDLPAREQYSIDYLILKFLRENGGSSHRQPIKDYLYETAGYISMRYPIARLLAWGYLINPRPGYYALAPKSDDTSADTDDTSADTDDTPPTNATP